MGEGTRTNRLVIMDASSRKKIQEMQEDVAKAYKRLDANFEKELKEYRKLLQETKDQMEAVDAHTPASKIGDGSTESPVMPNDETPDEK